VREKTAQELFVETRLTGGVRGVLVGLNEQGEALIDFCGNTTGRQLIAVATVRVRREDVGKEAILLFEDGDVTRPLLVGLVQPPDTSRQDFGNTVEFTLDGKRVTLTAEQEICLRCGDASITLTRAGKVLIKGAYLLSKSTGTNRIKGGSVQLN
jgi:hypothetical protein